jgi:hypothetical protein
MGRSESAYYPPRARWYSPLRNLGDRARRKLALDRIQLPAGVSFWQAVGAFLIPGLGFYLRKPERWGRLALSACSLLLLIFFCWLGQFAATAAIGLMLSIHVSSITFLFGPYLAAERLRFRLGFTLAAMVALVALLYLPGRSWIENHWLLPLQYGGKVVVVRRLGPDAELRKGDWVAYSLPEAGGQGFYVRSGFGFGPLLAGPGDRVQFTPKALMVNGRPQPKLANMPDDGEWAVGERSWFVWPELAITVRGQAPAPATLSATLLRLGNVSAGQVVGKPFERWFWRNQMSP